MKDQMAHPVLETFTFRLLPGSDAQAFLASARQTEPLLRQRPGFRRRLLTEDQGQWGDHVEWRDMASAMAAAEAVMQDADFALFLAMIDLPTVQVSRKPILAQMT